MNKIDFINTDTTWEKYGLIQNTVAYKGKPTKYRTVERYDQLITFGTKRYELMPNEEVLKIANHSCASLGLKPFTQYPYKQKFDYVQNNQFAILDKGTRLNAFYAYKCEQIDREQVYVGLHIFNSIDRSTAFGAGAFTFRVKCQNQVLATLKRLGTTLPEAQTLDYIYQRHTGQKFTEDYFRSITHRLHAVMEKLINVIDSYKQMVNTDVDKTLFEKIIQSNLPQKVKPEYVPKEIGQNTLEVPKITQWELYNDFTEKIWHNQSTNLSAKQVQFNKLHELLPLQAI